MKISIKDDLSRFKYIVLFILFILGNSKNVLFAYLAFIFILLCILIESKEENIYMIFFLLPNIRILDATGITSLINVAVFFASLKYILISKRLNKKNLIVALFFLIWELLHLFYMGNYIEGIIQAINISFDIYIFLTLSKDANLILKFDKSYYSMIAGIFNSAAVFLIVNPSKFNMLFSTSYRLDAYGNDPNYYSIYILICICCLLITIHKSQNKNRDSLLVFILAFIGLLTASKMYVFCLLGTFFVYFLSLINKMEKKHFKAFARIILLGSAIFVLFRKIIIMFINKFIKRFNENFYNNKISNLTTGRTDNLTNYLKVMGNDFYGLLIGRGLSYYRFYRSKGYGILVAHNTYFDMILSMGIIGSLIFIVLIGISLNGYLIDIKMSNFILLIPLLVFFIELFGLSCFSTDMMWYMLVLAIQPILKKYNNIDSNY